MEPVSSSGDHRSYPEQCPEPLQSAAAMHDPFEWYARKRRDGPVHYDPHRDVYDVFTYEDVRTALQDSDRLVRKGLSRSHRESATPFDYIDNAMVWSDGPAHTKSKSQLFNYFRPDLLEGLADTVEAISRAQLDAVLEGGPTFDFVTDFAVPVPLKIIMHVVGIPLEDHERLFRWLETFREVMNTEYSAVESHDGDRMAAPVEYFDRLVAERTESPSEDLISRLATETDLTSAEIGANCFDFVLAGQGTMSEFLANALYLFDGEALFENLDSLELSVVLEEVLRYRAALQSRARETSETVTLADTDIPAGETVILWIGAANRDPARYDRPETFVPERDPDHLAFGNGPHTCIGAPLARLQAPIILQTFLDRFERVDVLLEHARPKPKPSKLGFESLPVDTVPAR